jgi:hypothetical protein
VGLLRWKFSSEHQQVLRIQEWLVKQNQARSFGESIKVEKQLKIQGPKK